MAVDIGIVRGLIELQDDFTSQLGLAEASLSQFTEKNQQSLTAVAGVVGLVTAAFTAAAVAVYNLGQRGADVNDVAATLEQFSGSVEAANANLEALRAGTKGTIDDFTLMKDASHLLSAGVQLNAEDFGTLGEAAFVLQNRGLGGTKEMLDLVSDAMVTGRTRALSMALGVIDAGDAEANYAAKLGITKDQLSDTGKVEAKRIAIMEMLSAAVKDAGVQERDFGEQIEFAKTAVINWVDSLGQAIAASPALAAGMKAIQDAVAAAFGGDNSQMIEDTLELIKKGAILAVDFGLGAIELARVVNVAWSLIKATVLGTIGAVTMVLTAVVAAVEGAARVGAALKIIPDSAVESIKAVRVQLVGMTDSLVDQTMEASLGVIGHSKFDATLDKLGGTLFTVRDAIDGAAASQVKGNEVVDIAAKNAATLAKLNEELTAKMIDRQKIEDALWKIEEKSLDETSALWNEYFNLRVHNSGTTVDAQQADIERWFNDEVAKLDDSDRNWQEHYEALEAIANEKLEAIMIDWDTVKDKSIEALRETAEIARNTYNEMVFGSLHYTRDALEEQLQKTREAEDAARGMGTAYVDAHTVAATAAAKQKKELEAVEAAALAAKKAAESFSVQITKGNLAETAQGFGISDIGAVMKYAEQGFSFTEILNAIKGGYEPKNPKGPRIEGFAEGGTVMVGERGPEAVRLPFGSQVFPTGMSPRGTSDGGHITNHIYVNDTLRDSARKVADEIMRTAKQSRMFGAS